jgi:Uri superfamily endonuclease
MPMGRRTGSIAVFGGNSQAGTYLLRLRLARKVRLRFGRFNGGAAIPLPSGEYVYVGSALAGSGAASLARRLVRHATRSRGRPPHALRRELIARCRRLGLGGAGLEPPLEKTIRWHIDYLLDLEAVELAGVVVLRSRERLEGVLAGMLEEDPQARIVARGLGAGDAAGRTHLLRVEAGEEWWRDLEARVGYLLVARPGAAGGDR